MPPIPRKTDKPLRIAIIYWRLVHSVGGIATHLNRLREAAIAYGDTCHILMSASQKTKRPQVFRQRKWVRGGDTNIWVCGEAPHHPRNVKDTVRWLEVNYDAVVFGFLCPNKITAYPTPDFLPVYDVRLPKIAWIMDGYWNMYKEWAEPLLPLVDHLVAPLDSYARPIRELGYDVTISPFPFSPLPSKSEPRSSTPLVVWPNQWNPIKRPLQFLRVIPDLDPSISVELYSCGIRYYQLRSKPEWKAAVDMDLFKDYNGDGRATYFGNVDLPQILRAYQRAWFTVNIQGHNIRGVKLETYGRGSYNNAEVEALWYGACPVLHSSICKTAIPDDVYLSFDEPEEIPSLIFDAIHDGFALAPSRQARAREFVKKTHLASERYIEMRSLLT